MSFYTTVAQYYDAENADKRDDIDLYLELAEEVGHPIFEVGCGSGRVVFPLARAGYEVVGMDNNEAMLTLARERVEQHRQEIETLTLLQGDILTAPLPKQKFKLVLLSYNMLMHFHEQDQQIALLRRMRSLIAEDGLLVIDLPNAGETFATADSDAITLERTFIEPVNGHMVMQQAVSTLDRTSQLMRVLWIYDEITEDGTLKRTTAPTLFRYFFPYEVQLLLQISGFQVDAFYGDTDCSPFEDTCPRMIVFAQPIPNE